MLTRPSTPRDQNRQASLASPSNAPSLVYEKNQNPGRTPLSLFEPSHSFPKEPKNSVAASTNRSSSKGGLVYSQSPQLASAPPRASPSPYSALSPSFQLFTPNHSFDKRPSEPNGSNQTTPQPLASKAPLASKPPAASKQSYWPPAASSSNFHNSTQAPPKQQRLKNKQAVTHSTSQQNNQRPLAPALPSNAPPLPYQGPNLLAGQFFPLSGKITKTPSKKRVYNTDTLARDILAAYGMHPKGSRLNAHLEKLNGRFGFDLHTTDVSTLRWDILDPGGPDMNIYKSPGRSQQGPTAGTDRGPTVPLTSANSAPKVISSQSVFSPGPILQKSSSLRQEFHPETSSMLPQQSAQISLAGIPGVELQIGPSKSALPSISQSAFERANTPNVNTRSLQKQTSGAPGSPLSVQVIIPSSSQSLQLLTAGTEGRDTPKRGRGRPPKTYTPSDHKTLTPRLRERPPKEQNGDTSIKRKRGRPFKNKPEPDSTDSELTPVPEAFYISFICEWEDCPAELHNLDTLTAHVFKVHGVKTGSGHFVCKWKNCRLSTATEDEHGRSDHERADNHLSVSLGDELREFLSKKPASKDSQSEIDEQFANEQDAQDHEAERDATERFFEYDSLEEWKKHVIEVHVTNVAFYQGEGPGTTQGTFTPHLLRT